jgi:hypothetical protein
MKVVVKLRFGASKSKIESFGSGRYLVYLLSEKTDPDVKAELYALLSRSLGVPGDRIEYAGKDANGDLVFET